MKDYLAKVDDNVCTSKRNISNEKNFAQKTFDSLNDVECFFNNFSCCFKIFRLYKLLK